MGNPTRDPKPSLANRVRIIGGVWRGRQLNFPDVPGLRPTPDRVRETLFNWLGQRLHGQRCLDLFAGSGALGLEAASRGAAAVTLLERDAQAVAALQANVRLLLGAENTSMPPLPKLQVRRGDALAWLRRAPTCEEERFEVIFIDPPFTLNLLPQALTLAAPWLALDGTIYAEFGRMQAPDLAGWQVWRSGQAGQTQQVLLKRLDAVN